MKQTFGLNRTIVNIYDGLTVTGVRLLMKRTHEHIFQIAKIVESVEFTTYQGKHFSASIVFVVSSVTLYLYFKNRDHCLVIKNKFSIKRETLSHAAEVAQSVRALDSHTEDKVLKSRTKQT